MPPAARWGHLETLWRMREGWGCAIFSAGDAGFIIYVNLNHGNY